MARLDETRVVGVIEAIFSLELDDQQWLQQVLSALTALCGSEHQYLGFFYDASDVEHLKLWNVCATSASAELASAFTTLRGSLTPELVKTLFREAQVGSAWRSGIAGLAPMLDELERAGWGDVLDVNGVDASGVGCFLMISCRDREPPPTAADLFFYRSLAANLAAAFRYRRQLGKSTRELEAGPALSRDKRGEGAACTGIAKERIRSSAAATAVLRASNERRAWWNALSSSLQSSSGRLTLVDTFEENGKRYIVVRENMAQGVATLTERERQIVGRATTGASNKQIAYDLGISDATVRVLMARAASRIGVRTRRELLAHPALQDMFPAEREPRSHRGGDEAPVSTPLT